MPPTRLLFLGMQGQFTRIVLERLLAAGVEVCGLLLSGPILRPLLPPPPPDADPLALRLFDSFVETNALHLAWQAGIPVYESGPLGAPALTELLRTLAPEVACVACFDRIIPARLLALPRHGFLNVHPSLLPHFRGPEPLFWQLRAGINPVGVTVHWMDAGLDTGDIAGQRTVALPDGSSGGEADTLCGLAGGDLLAEILGKLADGSAQRRPQPAGGSYQPSPTQDDFALDTGWDVRRVFNFMRGTAEWGMNYPVSVNGTEWRLRAALGWEASASLASVEVSRGVARVGFASGVLVARLAGKE
ncbi:MAG: hypothetical protein DWI57_12055 [Chloroflexi bacterium]|nr:MAG: hypothetical protein DWI57_12055 [Chloroflexota bacterium]